jgi:hypothetical protein
VAVHGKTVGDFLLDRLGEWDINRLFLALPPLPPTLRPEQQENLATALAGDVDAKATEKQLVLQDVRRERQRAGAENSEAR